MTENKTGIVKGLKLSRTGHSSINGINDRILGLGRLGVRRELAERDKNKHKSCLQIPKRLSCTHEGYLEGKTFAQYK